MDESLILPSNDAGTEATTRTFVVCFDRQFMRDSFCAAVAARPTLRGLRIQGEPLLPNAILDHVTPAALPELYALAGPGARWRPTQSTDRR
jgi:hypothetical protein